MKDIYGSSLSEKELDIELERIKKSMEDKSGLVPLRPRAVYHVSCQEKYDSYSFNIHVEDIEEAEIYKQSLTELICRLSYDHVVYLRRDVEINTQNRFTLEISVTCRFEVYLNKPPGGKGYTVKYDNIDTCDTTTGSSAITYGFTSHTGIFGSKGT